MPRDRVQPRHHAPPHRRDEARSHRRRPHEEPGVPAARGRCVGACAAALEKFRKRNVRIMLLFQSLAQLDVNYGHAVRRAIMDNIAINVILGLEDQESKEYFSQKAGSKIHMRSTSNSSGGHSSTEVKDRAIEPEVFSKLHYRLIVFSHGRIFKPFKAFSQPQQIDESGPWYDDEGNTLYFETLAKKFD